MENQIFQQIAVYVTPVLLAVVTWFLKRLIDKFDKLDEGMSKQLVRHENFEQRIFALEKRIDKMGEQIKELQEQLWEFISRK